MDRPLHRVRLHDLAAGLVGEQVHRVRGVVPQQVVGPAARLAERVHVRAAEEVGLHVHLLDLELAGLDPPVNVLVAGVEAARVADHRDQAGRLLQRGDFLGACKRVGERDLDLHVLACLQAGDALRGVHLRRRAQDHCVDSLDRQAVGEVGAHVGDAVFRGDLLRLVELAADQRDDLDAVDQLDRVQMLDAERAGTGQRHLDRRAHPLFSRIRWPTAVFDAGTWKKRCLTVGFAPPATSAIAPRAISHITSSMPSEPASRTYSMCGTLRQALGVGDQPVEEAVVPLGVDQPGARPLQLVAHAAGAPDLHAQRLVVASRSRGGSPARA